MTAEDSLQKSYNAPLDFPDIKKYAAYGTVLPGFNSFHTYTCKEDLYPEETALHT